MSRSLRSTTTGTVGSTSPTLSGSSTTCEDLSPSFSTSRLLFRSRGTDPHHNRPDATLVCDRQRAVSPVPGTTVPLSSPTPYRRTSHFHGFSSPPRFLSLPRPGSAVSGIAERRPLAKTFGAGSLCSTAPSATSRVAGSLPPGRLGRLRRFRTGRIAVAIKWKGRTTSSPRASLQSAEAMGAEEWCSFALKTTRRDDRGRRAIPDMTRGPRAGRGYPRILGRSI